MKKTPFFRIIDTGGVFILYNDDCIKTMKTIKSNSIDMIFADPPYFLSNGGKTISSGKIVSVNKGEWDKKENYKDTKIFTFEWLSECYRILKQKSSIWISGTYHNIFELKEVLDKVGFKLINIVIWEKTNPPPLIVKNKLRFSYEFIIWADKGSGHIFNYDEMFVLKNEEMKDVWTIPSVTMSEKKFGYHPTQKPEKLLQRIIKASTIKGQTVLDPFMGSGTTGVVCKRLKRSFIGIEKEKEYFDLCQKRIINEMQKNEFDT